jgi:hypothetical protein
MCFVLDNLTILEPPVTTVLAEKQCLDDVQGIEERITDRLPNMRTTEGIYEASESHELGYGFGGEALANL